jgi:hypothetical protein
MSYPFNSMMRPLMKEVAIVDGANLALTKMRDARLRRIDPVDKFVQSKLAWKLATLRQPLLYRVVALAESLLLVGMFRI